MPRKCNCSGPCGPQLVDPDQVADGSGGVTRREFIALASIGAAAATMPVGTPEARAAATKDLENWKQALLKPAAPRRYRSGVHSDARMHLGGIGTGNFEVGADGQFSTWQLFNTLRDGYIPLSFAVRSGGTAKILQTSGGLPGAPRIKSIEMTGEYPITTLRIQDDDLPVRIEMSAFTPFAPLDTEFSSMPLACFVFKVNNPTGTEQSISLAAFMQNPVGYDAMGVPISFNSIGFNSVQARWNRDHPNYGGNYNEILREGETTFLCMEAQPAGPITVDRPLDVYTNLPIGPFHAPYEERPATLTIESLHAIPDEATSVAPAQSTVVWLEDPPAELAVETLRAAVRAARSGATLIISGKTIPLLRHYAEITQGRPLDGSTIRPDTVFEDFENGYDNWTVEGTAFGSRPATGTLPSQQQVSGFLGHGLVNSFVGGDDPIGKLTSKPFTIDRHYIRFLIGGGSEPTTQIRLVVDGNVVRAASGVENERLLPTVWNVRELSGRTAHIEIVDDSRVSWGHINVDQIEFGDLPGSVEVLEMLDEILPARFTGVMARPDSRGLNHFVDFTDIVRRDDAHDESLATGQTLIARPLGRGRVILASGPILDTDHVELIGARAMAYRTLGSIAGARLQQTPGVPSRAPGFGSLALGVAGKSTSHSLAFADWKSAWTAFERNGFARAFPGKSQPTAHGQTCNGAIATEVTVPAGKSVEVPFFLAWRYPNKYSSAGENMGCHYATRWQDARSVVRAAARDFKNIRGRTERFRSVFYDSTLPYWMLDCMTSQASTIRHIGVVFRVANGDVYGWEGSNGCCDPTCTHVWGYVQNMARLFPDLERDMRRVDFKHQQGADGGINNRTQVPSPPHPTGERPFTDGHCSCVLKAYREALNTTDEKWLKEYWTPVKRAVEYLMARDAATSNGTANGLLEDDQWNTYDEAIHGVTTFIGTYYLAALRAGEEWAKRVGDLDFAGRCRAVFLQGQTNLVARCWNGEYFQQDLPGYEKLGGEVGPGCMADQLIGQWWAHQLGLGYLLPEDKVRAALRAVFKYNWKPDLTGWRHMPRAFAGAGDKGLIICTWPRGGRPANVMLYSDEVWTGIEYQAAAHMIYEGMVEEGFAIVKGARDRYDGVGRAPIPRNPWNEIECGGHYARAGSSWALLLAMSGWLYDGTTGELTFRPRHTPNDFRCLFTAPEGWGTVSNTLKGAGQRTEILVVEGKLVINRLHLDALPGRVRVSLGGRSASVKAVVAADGVSLEFRKPITIGEGHALTVAPS